MRSFIGLSMLVGLVWLLWPSKEIKLCDNWDSTIPLNIEGVEYNKLTFYDEHNDFTFYSGYYDKLQGTFSIDGNNLILYYNNTSAVFNMDVSFKKLVLSDSYQRVEYDVFEYDPGANTTGANRLN